MNKKPLYTKVNRRSYQSSQYEYSGGDHKHLRNTKKFKNLDAKRISMKGRNIQARDYTPLYKYLISNVGRSWDDIYSEIKPRLKGIEREVKNPIFYIVEINTILKDGKLYYSEDHFFCIKRS
jgi:CRISPR/Cas system-associated endonuclease/helicase Cas3